ncbi:MAG: class I SAM-dependent methyltransferase [Nitriliruptorales bacterium]|nr:class I SAM-dependent methyltransferase [Nitriliruptorales bacterium]
MTDHLAINRANWDERVDAHARSKSYRVDELASDPAAISGVVEFDRRVVGDVTGLKVLHLQCHIGTDTVSWGKLGAREVVGYDFSQPALDVAADLAKRAGVAARWYCGDLYDAPEVIGDEAFDLVYTGVGAIGWLPDIRGWAEVVGHFVAPGGRFFIRDAHPVLNALDYEDPERLSIIYPYFETNEPMVFDEGGTYVDHDVAFEHNRTVEWNHGLAETIQALLDVGLLLDDVAEHTFTDWQPFDRFEQTDPDLGHWALREEVRSHLPTMFHLLMHRPR